MRRGLALASVLLLFLFGVVIGALGMHLYEGHRPPGPPRPGLHGGDLFAGPFGRHLERRLELTPEQLTAIDDILDRSRIESREIREQTAPRVHEVMAEAHDRILALLTPEQRRRLEALHEEHPHRLQRWFLGHGGAGLPHEPSHRRQRHRFGP